MIVTSLSIAHTASAGREVNSRLANGNAAVYCGPSETKGMVWLSNDSSDYYSERVIVGTNSSWVNVQVRGAVNACSTPPQDADIETYAAGVRPEPTSAGILSISGNEFYRGNLSRYGNYGWSWGHDNGRPGTFLRASLNVAGVAPCSAAVNQISTGSVYVEIYRFLRYRQFGNVYDRGDGVERFNVPVTRSCPLNFTLNPSILVSSTIVNGGDPISATPTVNNTGTTVSAPAQWQVTKFRVNPGLPLPGAGVNNTLPVNHYGNGATIVSQGNRTFPRNNTNLAAVNETIPDLPPGTRICYTLSVEPRTRTDGRWSHSVPSCATVAVKPKVQILGGDLNVGRGSAYNPAPTTGSRVATSTSRSASTSLNYGSWSEYAIIASGNVTGMASGALYVGGSNTTNLCTLSLLTISNNTGSGCQANQLGNFAFTTTAPNVATRFPVDASIGGGTADLYSLASSQTYSVNAPSLNVTSSQPFADNGAGKGRWVVINDPDVDITITGNLTYANSGLSQIDDIPQIVIIARNITIAPNVTNVDAWLIAVGTGSNGYVNTCGSVTAGNPTSATVNSGTCTQKLTVNGPILANKLYMYRTLNNAASNDPAEVFNLRADAYIWASAYSPGNGRVPTVSTKELPPRF